MNIFYTNQFKKDYKRIKKQNKDLIKLQDVIEKLLTAKDWNRNTKIINFLESGKIIVIVILNRIGF